MSASGESSRRLTVKFNVTASLKVRISPSADMSFLIPVIVGIGGGALGQPIIATIHRSAKVTLRWKEHAEVYIGSLDGVEFLSPGPKSHTYRTHR